MDRPDVVRLPLISNTLLKKIEFEALKPVLPRKIQDAVIASGANCVKGGSRKNGISVIYLS